MNLTLFRFLCVLSFAAPLAGAAQTQLVTADNLEGWRLSGASGADVDGTASLSLPAGATLARGYDSTTVVMSSVSTPLFSAVPANWPIAQVGPAAVACAKSGTLGQVILLVGDQVTVLPESIELEADGRASRPLELALAYSSESRSGIVMIGGRVYAFTGSAGTARVEIELASGDDSTWPFEALEVQTAGAVLLQTPTTDSSAMASESGGSSTLQAALAALRRLEAEGTSHVADGASQGNRTSSRSIESTTRTRLEVFTPPPVRRAPAAVRATIARKLQQ